MCSIKIVFDWTEYSLLKLGLLFSLEIIYPRSLCILPIFVALLRWNSPFVNLSVQHFECLYWSETLSANLGSKVSFKSHITLLVYCSCLDTKPATKNLTVSADSRSYSRYYKFFFSLLTRSGGYYCPSLCFIQHCWLAAILCLSCHFLFYKMW